jgi:predicted phage terminase large subunit-like protein
MFSVYLRKAVENGKVIFPKKFCQTCDDHKDGQALKCLQCLRAQKSAHSFSAQYLNDPIDAESVEFKTEWVQKFEFNKDTIEKLSKIGAIMSIDPAVGLTSANDYTGIVITKVMPNTQIYVLEALQKRLAPDQLINEVFALRKTYGVRRVLLETTASQTVFMGAFKQEMVRRKDFFTIEEVGRSTKESKIMRIRALIPFYANGFIFHRPGLHELEYQLVQFPRNTHDDIIDALAHQVPFWKNHTLSAPKRDEAPYMSMNWWKKQTGSGKQDRVKQLFGDLIKD